MEKEQNNKVETVLVENVKRVVYENKTFSVIVYETENKKKKEVKAVGERLPRGASAKLTGKWEKDKKGEDQFVVSSFEIIPPNTRKGIVKYLSSETFRGIGPVTAEKIAAQFGTATLDVIQNNPERLIEVPGLSAEKIGILKRGIRQDREYADLAVLLGACGLTPAQIARVNENLAMKSENSKKTQCEIIQENPYIMLDNGVKLDACDKVARHLGRPMNSPMRIRAAVNAVLADDLGDSHGMFMMIQNLKTKSMDMLNEHEKAVKQEELDAVLGEMAENTEIIVRAKQAVYRKTSDEAEYNTAHRIVDMLKIPCEVDKNMVERAVNSYCSQAKRRPSAKQQAAINAALSNRLFVLTGGPGTGKTTITTGIIACHMNLYPEMKVVCMAPTGKAAKRMTEATRCQAQTIHSRLHLYDESAVPEHLENALVIVDESSMIDNFLMSKLMTAIDEKTCHMVIVGDVDQLPSVGPGAVLSELINSGVVPFTKLTEIFRQKNGGLIVENAARINYGKHDVVYNDTDFLFVKAESDTDAADKIKQIYVDEVKKWGIDQVALLTPRRSETKSKYVCVADHMNEVLRDLINPTPENSISFQGKKFQIGDRVMQWKNGKLSSNGDIGVVTDITRNEDGNPAFAVRWESGIDELIDEEASINVGLAYAMSIHKSQGSEYACVIIPMVFSQRGPLFQKNLLYTAVTRAKKKVIIVGSTECVDYTIDRRDNSRPTLLGARLKYAMR